MSYVPEFLLVASVHLLAVMSPGPDFAMIMRSALCYSRRSGVYSAIGLALGIAVHVTYSLVGIGLIISKSIVLFNTIKYLGALYLIYLGYQALRAKKTQLPSVAAGAKQSEPSPLAAIRAGFLTNVLNPKATLFFLGLFTQVIHPTTPLAVQVLYGLEMCTATFLWFAGVATLLSAKQIRERFTGVQHYFEKAFGAILIAIGIKIATTK